MFPVLLLIHLAHCSDTSSPTKSAIVVNTIQTHIYFKLGIRLLEQDSYEKVDTLEQLQKQLEDTRSINLRLFEDIREKNDREKIRIKKLEDSHNVSRNAVWN